MRLISPTSVAEALDPAARHRPPALVDARGSARRAARSRRRVAERHAGAVDAAVELLELGDHRLDQVAGRRLVGGDGAGLEGHADMVPDPMAATGESSSSPTTARAAPRPPRPRRSRAPPRVLPAPAREHVEDPEALAAEVQATLFENLDEETWERLEEALIMADVGAKTTAEVVAKLEREAESGDARGRRGADRAASPSCSPSIARTGDEHIDLRPDPTVILMVGVNGTGKTTTLGKLAWHLKNELGQNVVLGAADTFRAAAVEQLEGWAERADVRSSPAEGQDPGRSPSTRRQGRAAADVILIDTAGRLHTQDQLMAELTKIRRVIASRCPTRRTRRCSPSTRPPARTGCARPSSSPRRSRSTASC